MQNAKTRLIQENKTHNLLWDIEIQTNQLIAASSDLVLINQIKKVLFNEFKSEREIKRQQKSGRILRTGQGIKQNIDCKDDSKRNDRLFYYKKAYDMVPQCWIINSL